jgi:putative membrane protein
MKRVGVCAFVLTAAVAVGCNSNARDETRAGTADATGASVGTAGDVDRNEVKSSDKDFVNDVAVANMAEIELGRMAVSKSSNAQVKRFGQMMIDDHTKAGDKLMAAVSPHNITFPTQLDDKHRSLQERLTKLQGAEFDREYAKAMVDGHQDVSDKLESRIDKAKLSDWKTKFGAAGAHTSAAGSTAADHAQTGTVTPEQSDNVVTMAINQWAAESYPVVQMHLNAAKTLEQTVQKNKTKK